MTATTFVSAAFLSLVLPVSLSAQVKPDSTKTQIVFLGTGNPVPNPDKSGPSVAIVVNGASYIVDAGPGVVRRATQATQAGVRGLENANLKRVFITHLHSDHTLGLPDLMYTPWVVGRTEPLEVYGPPGIASMVHHIVQAWREDNYLRIYGLEKGNKTGNRINAHEIKPGVIYKDKNVTVTAFPVPHGSWKYAFGYRFQTADRTIVLSGDTGPSTTVAPACSGCDVLIHEVYTEKGYDESNADWRKYIRSFHTSTRELGAIAAKAHPGLLILSHQMYFARGHEDETSMLAELGLHYKGKVASAHDLDIF